VKVRDGQKTQRRDELHDQEKGRVWIPSQSGITGNEKVDEAAKNALQEQDRPQDLINWIKKTAAKNRQERWAQGKKHHEIQRGN
jgi:hypothetical protein